MGASERGQGTFGTYRFVGANNYSPLRGAVIRRRRFVGRMPVAPKEAASSCHHNAPQP